jgi:hypothetical protein
LSPSSLSLTGGGSISAHTCKVNRFVDNKASPMPKIQ